MRAAVRWGGLVAGVLVALGVSAASYSLATYSWNQVVDYRGPYAAVKLPPSAPGVPGTRHRGPRASEAVRHRVVYVIVDGLRDDESRRMPALSALRAKGVDGRVRTAQPALSFPNWTTLLTGAPQRISGVTTNWFEERVPVESLLDVALSAEMTVAVAAPSDFEMLYGVRRTPHVYLRDWEKGAYMSGGIVDNAIRLAEGSDARLVLVHLPDIDEAGHAAGGASTAYRTTARRVDADLARLVGALADERTSFVVASDHGHIDTGGHGGWEDVVTRVPVVFSGAGVPLGVVAGTQDQIAPTVALMTGLPVPRHATGAAFAFAGAPSRAEQQRAAALSAYAAAVTGDRVSRAPGADDAEKAFRAATAQRAVRERGERAGVAAGVAAAAALVVLVIALASWRAALASGAGTLAYLATYNGLYFGLHRYGLWSLSSFNSEDLLKAFMNARMLEAVVAGLVAAFVAAEVYLALRREPKRPEGPYLAGWLSLGVTTVLTVQATLALQVAWYLWRWGASVTWDIPDLMWGFKYDLDLIQLTALGAAVLIAPVLTWLVGRYHPIRRPARAAR